MNPPVGKKANVRHVEQVEGLHMVDMIFFFFLPGGNSQPAIAGTSRCAAERARDA